MFDAEADSAMDHIELARWCDLLLVAPASADFLGKLNAGYADNLLLTLCLASKQPVAVAPAMNQQMYANAATADNIAAAGGAQPAGLGAGCRRTGLRRRRSRAHARGRGIAARSWSNGALRARPRWPGSSC